MIAENHRLPGFALVAAIATLAAACAAPAGARGGATKSTYDSQACAEEALRRHPDPEALDGAAEHFTRACSLGDPAACSTLGVMHETGEGVERDDRRAQTLYRWACEKGDMHACANLGALLLRPDFPAGNPQVAFVVLGAACNAGRSSACATIERARRRAPDAAAPAVAPRQRSGALCAASAEPCDDRAPEPARPRAAKGS